MFIGTALFILNPSLANSKNKKNKISSSCTMKSFRCKNVSRARPPRWSSSLATSSMRFTRRQCARLRQSALRRRWRGICGLCGFNKSSMFSFIPSLLPMSPPTSKKFSFFPLLMLFAPKKTFVNQMLRSPSSLSLSLSRTHTHT